MCKYFSMPALAAIDNFTLVLTNQHYHKCPEKSKSCDRQVQRFRGDSLVVEIDGLLYNGTINCMFDTDSFPGIV